MACATHARAEGGKATRSVDARPSPAEARADSEYSALIDRAISEFDLGHWTEAKAFFKRAHLLRPSARTLRGLGLASYELRSYVEALIYLRQALASAERPLTEEMRAEVKATIEEAKSFLAYQKLELEPHDVMVRVDGQPAVFDDDGALLLDPGQHEIQLESSGFEPMSRTFSAKGGEHSVLRLTLHPQPAPPSQSAATTRPMQRDAALSPHDSSFWASLGTPRKVALGLGAGGVIGVGIGTAFAILALSANNASKDGCSNDVCDAGALAERRRALARADVATVAFIAGGALLGAGAAVYFTAPKREQRSTALQLTPALAPRALGVALDGRF
jgi:tetratricopeptide (TPR) repeat protein